MSLDDLKKVVRQHIDLSWNKGRLALAEQLHARDFLYKNSFVELPLDSAGFCQLVSEIRSAMPDLEVVLEECLAEGNQVFTWSTLIGTIAEPSLGYQPSDRVLSITAMAFWTLTPAGEIQEISTLFDVENFRAQLGLDALPYPPKTMR